jgi:Flp pilus assembly protein TadG
MKTNNGGQAILEVALVLPFLMFLILAGADFLWYEHQAANLSYITTQAAVCATQTGCDPEAYSKNAAAGLLLKPDNLTVSIAPKSVTLTYHAVSLFNFLPAITLTRTATTP